ncbi:hypothetical protein EYF80_040082 [Liparis tanakae]|uniref:Uncharacterized protein n=1 Tax=Liparis tanakae TaxID=230148 RepID=A0A4Z2G9W3_9TELE|nr:hypothetical protein EYF80_040082 [Liparis tanakae]
MTQLRKIISHEGSGTSVLFCLVSQPTVHKQTIYCENSQLDLETVEILETTLGEGSWRRCCGALCTSLGSPPPSRDAGHSFHRVWWRANGIGLVTSSVARRDKPQPSLDNNPFHAHTCTVVALRAKC